MNGQWYQYGGRLYQVHEVAGAFPHSPVKYTAEVHNDDGFISNEDDPWAILELVMRGIRVNADGTQFTPPEQEPLLKALERGVSEGWLVRTHDGYQSEITQSEVAHIILPQMSVPLTSDPARALRDRLKRAGIKIYWSQKRG